jgi:hypothetical protein
VNKYMSELQFVDKIIKNTTDYLLENQELDGEYTGAIWSEKCVHYPTFNPHAGGSHHIRTAGPAAWVFVRQKIIRNDIMLLTKAEDILDWVCSRQYADGALDEITNNEKPSRWHGDKREGSSISLAIVVHGMYEVLKSGKLEKPQYYDFIKKAAGWQLSMELPPGSGNFLHSEGYPVNKFILNACSHAVETLLCAVELSGNPENETCRRWLEGVWRGVEAFIKYQLENGCYPYSSLNDSTISYTATVCWCAQNMCNRLRNDALEQKLKTSCARAIGFLESVINTDGSIKWSEYETHGQKFRTYPIVMMLRVLLMHGAESSIKKALTLLKYLENRMYDSQRGLLNLLDVPLGKVTQVLNRRLFGEKIFETAFNQADIVDLMLDVKKLMLKNI